MALRPLASAELIASRSLDITIDQQGVEKTAAQLKLFFERKDVDQSVRKQHPLFPQERTRETVDWMFVINLLNFSFWSSTPGKDWVVRYHDENYTDYWALCSAIRRAKEEGIAITTPEYFATISEEKVRHVFRSETEVQLSQLDRRTQHLNQAGKVIMEKFDGSFSRCIEQCQNSAVKLVDMIVENFPSFRDEGVFEGTRVAFYKRAQILVADFWSCFGESWGRFDDINTITMFADYRVPQVLRHYNVLKYSDELKQHLREAKLIEAGGRWEVEIRGCTIWAVELIRRELVKIVASPSHANGDSQQPINSVMIDFYLWDSSTELNLDDHSTDNPIHRTRTIFY